MRVRLVLCVALLCLALPLIAQDAKVFSEVVGMSRVLEGDNEIRILAEPATSDAVSIEVRQVTRDGVGLNRKDSFRVTYDATAHEIAIKPAADAKAPGAYTVALGATTAKIAKPQIITLTLTRAAPPKKEPEKPQPAQFQIDSSLYVERIISFPWKNATRTLPASWIVRETGGKFAMVPATPTVTTAILSKKASDLGTFEVTFPKVEPNQSAEATIRIVDNRLWIGDANATVQLVSNNLAKSPVYKVVIRSRFSYFWLVLAIIAGVGVGWIVKQSLELRGAVLAEKLLAAREVEKALALEKNIADSAVRRQIAAERRRLDELIAKASATVEEVKELTKKVADAVKQIAEKAKTDRAAAVSRLDAIAKAIGRPERQATPFSGTVRAARSELDVQKRALDDGEIGKPAAELARIEDRAIGDVARDVLPWRAEIASAVDILHGWSELGKVAQAIETKADALMAPETLEELDTTLDATADITARLRSDVAKGIRNVYATIQYVIEKLGTSDRLLEAKHAVSDLLNADLTRQFEKLEGLRRAHDILIEVIKEEGGVVDAGDFRKAVQALAGAQAKPLSDLLGPEEKEEEEELSEVRAAEPIASALVTELDAGVPRSLSEDEIQKELGLVHRKRDWIYGVLIIVGGVIIFRNSFVGTLEDFGAAFLWGFSVDLTSATLTTYARPLMAKTPFR